MTTALGRGRNWFAERAWGAAYSALSEADAAGDLELEDLERLALAAYLTGNDDEATRAWTRAHDEALQQGARERAARSASSIALGLSFRGEIAPAAGWYARAERALEGCDESAEHGLVQAMRAMDQMFTGDPQGAERLLADSLSIGQRHGDADLQALARLGQGLSRVMQGQGATGIPLLDEVMASVTSGAVSPMYAGIAYCVTVLACAEMFDLRRAREWTTSFTRWCDAQQDLVPYRGNCLVHRCQIMQLDGAWTEARKEAERACSYLSGPLKWEALGAAYYQLGELQRLRGEFAEAEQSYRLASGEGRQPQPGLALLRLAQGRLDVALAALRRGLAEAEDPPTRSRLLPAAVEILTAAGDSSAARAAAEELVEIARMMDAPYLHAVAAHAEGAALLAAGDARAALARLRAAASAWRALEAPYEVARVRVLIGRACLAMDDAETSAMELDAARAAFEQLGAVPDLEGLDPRTAAAGGLTPREIEVLKLVASGRTNRVIARELVLSERTVAHHVSSILTKIGVPSRAAATAYAYEHGLV